MMMNPKDIEKLFNTPFGSVDTAKHLTRMASALSGNEVKDELYEPKPGQKVLITEFDNIPSSIVAKLARQKYSIITEVFPIPIGENGDYHFEYEIYVEGGDGYSILPWNYHILTDKEIEKINNGFRV